MQNDRPKITWVDSLVSTNTTLMERLKSEALDNGFCLSTRFQTSGRGQAGNSWESSRGENLLFSLLIHSEKFPLDRQFVLSKVVSVAILRYLKSKKIDVKIKYPNDIFYGDRKLAGILIENVISGGKMKYSVVGIGLNVNQTEFEINGKTAISMSQIIGEKYDLERELENLCCQILACIREFSEDSIETYQSGYCDNLYRGKGFFQYQTPLGEEFSAEIVSVSDDGRLNLQTSEGVSRSFYFKEVKFVI